MASDPTNIYGDFGPIGTDVVGRLVNGQLYGRGHRSFAPVFGADATTSSVTLSIGASASLYETHIIANPHVVGAFQMVSKELLDHAFPGNRGIYTSRAASKYAILKGKGGSDGTIAPSNLLTLDWVRDAQPFVWLSTSPPSLLTLDWVQDGQPFATNDTNVEVTSATALYIRAGARLSSVNGNVTTSGANLWIYAEVTGSRPEEEISGGTLVIVADAGISLSGGVAPVLSTATLSIFTDISFAWEVPLDTSATLSITASTTCSPVSIASASITLDIQATVTADETVLYSQISEFLLNIQAVTQIVGLAQIVLPCQMPGRILNLSSNLPFGVWQTNPDAIFTWDMVFTCTRGKIGAKAPVLGYLVVMDHNPSTAPWWDATRIPVTNDEFLLSSLPTCGAGSWWFHVSAYNSVGIGPPSHYNVCYNHPPGDAGSYMEIDGFDTIKDRPLVAYAPITPHILTWGPATDLDPTDTVVYDLQIATDPKFELNTTTGSSEIVLEVDSVPANLYVVTQTLPPLVYFWRIRAFDGQQYSDWSDVGSFRVNHPPNAPTDVRIYQTG